MKKRALNIFPQDSPLYVIFHWLWRKQRGKHRPTMIFKEERNPVKALVLARSELFTFDPELFLKQLIENPEKSLIELYAEMLIGVLVGAFAGAFYGMTKDMPPEETNILYY